MSQHFFVYCFVFTHSNTHNKFLLDVINSIIGKHLFKTFSISITSLCLKRHLSHLHTVTY